MRRVVVHDVASTSTMSLDALQATKMRLPSADGCAHVGKQAPPPGFGASMRCPPDESRPPWPDAGGPGIPCSDPFFSMKCRLTDVP
jgi:hypothetical protein